MGRPRQITGYTVANNFASIRLNLEQVTDLLVQFHDQPPTSRDEWMVVYRNVIRALGLLNTSQRLAREGLEIARENGVVTTTIPAEALRQLRAQIDGALADLEEE